MRIRTSINFRESTIVQLGETLLVNGTCAPLHVQIGMDIL